MSDQQAAKSPARTNHSHAGPTPTNNEGVDIVSHSQTSEHSAAESNLRQAADAMDNTGWAVARLIACSVERVGQGRPRKGAAGSFSAKLGTKRAAEVMRKSEHTIKAYLAAWNTAAADGLCIPSKHLTPEDGWTAPLPDAEWVTYYANTKPRGVGIGQVEKRAAEDPEYAQRVAEVVAPERTPGATLTEWASSETQMKGILSGATGSARAARKFVAEAIKHDPAVAAAADQALEDRVRNTPPVRDHHEPSANTDKQYALQAVTQARKVRRTISDLVSMVNDLGDRSIAEAIIDDADWSITALTAIKSSLQGGQSMDEQLADLLNEEV